jgi:DNA-binding CsgD family transcriptional regulator
VNVSARTAIVIFGDVIHSRREPEAASDWLRALSQSFEEAYETDERLAPVGFTQGDELQALLGADADPLLAVLIGSLHERAMPMRWSIAAGQVVRGSGPATERSGEAFLRARAGIEQAKAGRDLLVVSTGEPGADRLLDGLAPVLGEMLRSLTPRQRRVASLMLVEGLRQADVAERLHVARATVSVAHARGGIRSIDRLVTAIRTIFRAGILAQADERAAALGAGGGL